MNFEKLRWWLKSKAVIKKDEWYCPVLQLTIITESYTIPGWRYPVTQPMQKYVICNAVQQILFIVSNQ